MVPRSLALATDLYELTMAAAYFASRVTATASFELCMRTLPQRRNYLVVAGLDQALAYLESLRFTEEDIAYLRSLPAFGGIPETFFAYLRDFKFTGEVWAIPEGTPAFQNEPLLRVTAPVIEAQLVETFLLTTINFQTMIASKAARVVGAAGGRDIVEFGSRRAHGTEAGLYAARAAYIAGCAGTSNVEAGLRFGIPVYGTVAHSFVMAFDDEVTAFRRYMETFPHNATLLIDTYDTIAAAQKIVAAGLRPQAVRLDSGELDQLSGAVRKILDEGGLQETRIIASGDLDESRIAALLAARAPVDAFGVGTRLATSYDEPALGGVYKLVELEVDYVVRGTMKTSPAKMTPPGRKQVWRRCAPNREYAGNVLALANEPAPPDAVPPAAEPLLVCVLRNGQRVGRAPALNEVRDSCRAALGRLPARLKSLEPAAAYPVEISPRLAAEQQKLIGVRRCSSS